MTAADKRSGTTWALFRRLTTAFCLLLVAGCGQRPGRTLKAGYGNAGPMTYRDPQGRVRGFAIDVLEEAARREGLRIEWVLPQPGVDEALRNGSLDLLPTGIESPERRKRFYVSAPWWSADLLALVDARGPIQTEAQLAGRRLAANAAGLAVARQLKPSQIVERQSATEIVSAVCSGDADAALIAGMYVREILAAMPPACRGNGLGWVPLAEQREYALIARNAVASEARRLRERIDDLALDGTLMNLALANPPVSTPQAARAMETARTRYQRRLESLATLGLLCVTGLLAGFLFWLQRSRARLRHAYRKLEETTSQRIEAQAALRESELRFVSVVNTAFDWVWEVNAEGKYTFASPQVEQLLGYTPAEIIGCTPFDLMPPQEAERMRTVFLELEAAREPLRSVENINLRKDGTAVVLETSGMPVLSPAGDLLGYRGMGRDISARKQQERQRSAQAAATRALAEATTVAEKMQGVLAALGGLVRARAGTAWYADGRDQPLHSIGVWTSREWGGEPGDAAPCDLQQAPAECVAKRLWAAQQPGVFDTGDCQAAVCQSAYAYDPGVRRVLEVPLRSENRTSGLLLLFGPEAPQLDEQISQTLSAVGSLCGEVLARERARDDLRRFVASSPTVIYALQSTPDGFEPFFISENLTELTGYSVSEALQPGWWLNNLHPDDRERVLAANSLPSADGLQRLEFRFRCRDGRYIWLRDEKRLLGSGSGELVGSWSDISQRVELERQLRQSQKMEAIGALAAGVAHDFNNLLTVINGYSTLVFSSLPPGDETAQQVREVINAGERAAALTRQLLAFSRRQELQPRVVKVAAIVAEMEKLLRRLIGEDIQLTLRNQSTAEVLADPSQLEQVLLNLVVNARDAMPEGGELTVGTADRVVDAAGSGLTPGSYAELTVSDTGVGMDPETMGRLFEPFFTTKEPGKGTGLGLATAYGIVHQSGGTIQVESRPGHGSEFRILLPRTAAVGPARPPAVVDSDWRGDEVILLVEDEPAVRRVTRETLRSYGYKVLEAANAGDALLISQHRPAGEIALLLTDVVMPRVTGIELAERLRDDRPGLRVLFMTGYADTALLARAERLGELQRLQKPFTPMALARKVREVLDAART